MWKKEGLKEIRRTHTSPRVIYVPSQDQIKQTCTRGERLLTAKLCNQWVVVFARGEDCFPVLFVPEKDFSVDHWSVAFRVQPTTSASVSKESAEI